MPGWYPGPPVPVPPFRSLSAWQQLKIISLTFLALAGVFGFYLSFPILIIYGRGTNKAWTPPRINCATCQEIVAHNIDLALALECVAWDNFQAGRQSNEVVLWGFYRCWVRDSDKGEWESQRT